jgi:hypothetical protein
MNSNTTLFAPDEAKHTHSSIMLRWLCALFVAGLCRPHTNLVRIVGRLVAAASAIQMRSD